MKAGSAFGLPLEGDGDGVVAVGGFAGVVALVEADAAAVAEVDCGDDFECHGAVVAAGRGLPWRAQWTKLA